MMIHMDKKKVVRDGYNKIAEKYLTERHAEIQDDITLLSKFVSFIEENDRVLDVGCGAGIPITKFLSEKFQVTGVDISGKQIELAKQNVPNGVFYCKDMTKLDFPDNYFGGMVAYYSIIHVPRNEQRGLFRNFYRMLKPNGVAILSLLNADNSSYVNNDFLGVEMFWSGYDAETNINILEEIGFEILLANILRDKLGKEGSHLFVLIRKLL